MGAGCERFLAQHEEQPAPMTLEPQRKKRMRKKMQTKREKRGGKLTQVSPQKPNKANIELSNQHQQKKDKA